MGHVVDPNRYDKFYMDKEYMLTQYRIAEKYLNIISYSIGKETVEEFRKKAIELEEKIRFLEDRVKKLFNEG